MSVPKVNSNMLARSFNPTPFSPTLSNLFKGSSQFSPFPAANSIPLPITPPLSLFFHATHLKTPFHHVILVSEASSLF